MDTAIEKVNGWLEIFGPAGPWILALLLIVIGYFVAKLVSGLLGKALGKTSFDEKLSRKLGQDVSGTEKGIAKFVFYLLMLCIVVLALGVAGQSEAVAPLQDMLSKILGFIPNLIAAAVIAFVAWILATLVKNILEGLLNASRVDERLGLGEKKPITSSVGLVAFFGILLFMLPTVLGALEMTEISKPISDMINQIFAYVPSLFSGIVLLAIGYLIAVVVQKILANVLGSIGVDGLPAKLGYSGEGLIAGKPLSLIISYIAMATILVMITAQAITVMNLGFLSDLATGFVDGYFQILGAVIIFTVAIYVANIVGQLISNPFWAKWTRIAILIFLGAVALQKADISSLTNETFQLLITAAIIASAFAIGVGGAISIGLGGREKAKDYLEKL